MVGLGVLRGTNVAGGEDGAVQEVGVGAQIHVVVAQSVLQGDGIGGPGGGGVNLPGDHGGGHTVHGHLYSVDIIHGHAGTGQGLLQNNLRGGAGGHSNGLALQILDSFNALGLVAHHHIRQGGGVIHLEDFCLALNAQLMGTVADLGNVNVAGGHGGNFGGAALELKGLNGQAHFLKVALLNAHKQGAGGAQVGHVRHADGGGLIGGGVGRGGLGADGRGLGVGRWGIIVGGSPAGGQGEYHSAGQCKREQFLLHDSSSLIIYDDPAHPGTIILTCGPRGTPDRPDSRCDSSVPGIEDSSWSPDRGDRGCRCPQSP